MYMPSIFEDGFLDGFFEPDYRSGKHQHRNFPTDEFLKTDVKENDKEFDLTMSVPGAKKEDIKLELNDGYLLISAKVVNEKEENDNKHYIRKERFEGNAQRSFYVGEHLKEEDIKAKFDNGVLKLTIPKIEKKPEIEQKKFITIE